MNLNEFFSGRGRIALGFSGGVDSGYLLHAAIAAGADITAYFVKTAFQPQFELDDAVRLAAELGARLRILELDTLGIDDISKNTADRCYHCKRAIFSCIKAEALADGCELIIDGSNASDDAQDRPGMRAVSELSVSSPLRLCGLTKDEIRRLSREAGLFTWDKPAYSCLATRIPEGRKITGDLLCRIEAAENELMQMGFSNFRVRIIEGSARLQFEKSQIMEAFARRDEICARLKKSFGSILLDLSERR